MEKSKIDSKNLEQLSDEELLNICGGITNNPDFVAFVEKSGVIFCSRKKTESECKQQDACAWTGHKCQYAKRPF